VGGIGDSGARRPGSPAVERWANTVYRDDEVLAGLERCDDALVFEWMHRTLPSKGSKVAWDRAPGEHSHWYCGTDEAQLAKVVSELVSLLSGHGSVIHAGDSLSTFAVRFPASGLRPVLPSLLLIPEHHFVLAEDEVWFLAFSFEGDVDLLRF
jgi:hypothetical protein